MRLVNIFTSIVIIITTFISSHIPGLNLTKKIEVKHDVTTNTNISTSTDSGAITSTPSGTKSGSSNNVNIHTGNSDVSVSIKNGQSTVTINGKTVNNSQTSTLNIDDWKYPGASVDSSSGSSLSLESSQSTDSITDWYKNKITSLGMNTTSFVKTSSNDKVLNKLVGANGSSTVSIEISQDNASAKVQIRVSI